MYSSYFLAKMIKADYMTEKSSVSEPAVGSLNDGVLADAPR